MVLSVKMNSVRSIKFVLILVLLEFGNQVSSNPIAVLSSAHRPETWHMFGVWPMSKRTFYLVITVMLAVTTFVVVLIFGIWTFCVEIKEFEEIRQKNLLESQRCLNTIEMRIQPSTSVIKEGNGVKPMRSVTFEALNNLAEAGCPISKSRSMDEREFNRVARVDRFQMGDSVSLN